MTEEIKAGQIIEYDKDNTPHFIIDGVDVSGCEHYWNTHNLELCKINFDNNYYSNGLPLTEKCNDHKDCYYRQLKRLEADNAKLKEENFKLDFKLGQIDIKKITLVENRQLAEENEKLKEALEEIKEVFQKYDSEEEGTVAELLHDVFEVYSRVCEVLKDE